MPDSSKRPYVLKQTCSFWLQVCLSTCDLFFPPSIEWLKYILWFANLTSYFQLRVMTVQAAFLLWWSWEGAEVSFSFYTIKRYSGEVRFSCTYLISDDYFSMTPRRSCFILMSRQGYFCNADFRISHLHLSPTFHSVPNRTKNLCILFRNTVKKEMRPTEKTKMK